MLQVKVNDSEILGLVEKNQSWEVVGHEEKISLLSDTEIEFHLMVNQIPVTIFLTDWNPQEKKITLLVNGKKVRTEITTELDLLLKKMGFENAGKVKTGEIKSPMPGLIHSLKVREGDVIKKGDPVLILEAMKMENVIKSPTDGTVKKIHVQEKMTVEKGTLMLSFE